ncbi:MAG: hypothetical protein HC827_22480 [Cyanobacteria bacterium RM1_2_2]|nr:hypothetical protein [Cyanobacteria bacterium RM1_2_2]
MVERANGQSVVLAIQDTTDLDFSSLQQTSGLGFINQSPQQGIKVHSCFAVSGKGEPLGLLHSSHLEPRPALWQAGTAAQEGNLLWQYCLRLGWGVGVEPLAGA